MNAVTTTGSDGSERDERLVPARDERARPAGPGGTSEERVRAIGTAPAAVATGGSARAVLVLGGREARRMLTSPGYLLLVGLVLLIGKPDSPELGRGEAYEVLDNVVALGGLATLFAVSLVATSSRRSGSDSMLDAAPLDPERRALGTALGVLLGPVALASLLTVTLVVIGLGLDAPPGVEDRDAATYGPWEYVALPITWLGAGLLAIAAARWLPWPGVPLALGVGLIFWVGWGEGLFYEQADRDHGAAYLIPYVITRNESGLLSSAAQGDLGWHAAFLFGLCLLALIAVLLRHRRPPAVLGLGVLAAVVTGVAGRLQLP